MSDERRGGDEGLSREIGTKLLSVYGAGTILGAGIYVLVGKVAGAAGYLTPLAFILAALVAIVNGMVYAELSTRSPRAGGPSDYVQKAFGREWLRGLIGWMIVATGVVSAATITTGFSGYLTHFFDVAEWIPRVALLVTLGAVAVAGARESAWFMAITTSAGVLGLLFVLAVGFFGSGNGRGGGVFENLPPALDLSIVTGVFSATFLSVYAYIGFEDLVHMAEEVEEPRRSMPRAIAFAVVVAALFYVLVSIAALNVLDPEALASSKAPLVAVVGAAGYPTWPLAILSLAIILNGALAQIIMATRVMYSLGGSPGAPERLATVNRTTSTPVLATAVATIAALALALFLPLATLAAITSFIMLLVFAASNAALVRLERRDPAAPFDVPVWLPWVGLVLSLVLAAGSFFVGGGH